MRLLLMFLLMFGIAPCLPAQSAGEHTHPGLGRPIEFPDIPGYQTLKCDFHIHTVFSDGNVWPTIRVEEAIRDGLDALALTEHLEYQPHAADIPHPDRNRSFQLARDFAEAYDILVVHGAEITRDMPPGHSNAIFIQDANALLIDDPVEVFREANRQGAFTFWNHPNWTAQKPDGITELTDLHRQLIDEDLLHGIEVVNQFTYSAEALQVAQENNLAIMGTSDIHGLIDWDYAVHAGEHRPITLVFATEKTEAAIKEAMEARRTVAWFNNTLIGNSEVLQPLIEASLSVASAEYPDNNTVLQVELENTSDAHFLLQSTTSLTFHEHADIVEVAPHSTQLLQVKTGEVLASFELGFRVLNAVTAPGQHPEWRVTVRPGN